MARSYWNSKKRANAAVDIGIDKNYSRSKLFDAVSTNADDINGPSLYSIVAGLTKLGRLQCLCYTEYIKSTMEGLNKRGTKN